MKTSRGIRATHIDYRMLLWTTREQAEQWAIENGFEIEQEAQ